MHNAYQIELQQIGKSCENTQGQNNPHARKKEELDNPSTPRGTGLAKRSQKILSGWSLCGTHLLGAGASLRHERSLASFRGQFCSAPPK